jgi:HEAT repeat protein
MVDLQSMMPSFKWIWIVASVDKKSPASAPQSVPCGLASLLGEDKIVGLNQLARLAGMDRAAMKLLKAKSLRKRLMAIITLGHLGEQSAWNDLLALAQSPHPIVSLSAARALVDSIRKPHYR